MYIILNDIVTIILNTNKVIYIMYFHRYEYED